VNTLCMEMEIFGEDYSAIVREWCKAHPNNEYTSRLVNALEDVSHQLQALAQEIGGRNSDDNEAASAQVGPPVGDDLDIPACLKRT
jgi:hypothetical protein